MSGTRFLKTSGCGAWSGANNEQAKPAYKCKSPTQFTMTGIKSFKASCLTSGGLLYKLNKGEPERIPTANKLHFRVPLIIYDDFGGQSNKAETQHDPAWDVFKGGFDLLGTQVAVILASMVDPTEPTFQIMQKYTHELFLPQRGVYKYDKVVWNQDYKGWKPRKSKDWIETNHFLPVPRDVYMQYDEMRLSLVEEMKQRIQDAIADSRTDQILKRLPEATSNC